MPQIVMTSLHETVGRKGWAVYNLPMMSPTLLAGIIISMTCSPGATTGNDIWIKLKQMKIVNFQNVWCNTKGQHVLISRAKEEDMITA